MASWSDRMARRRANVLMLLNACTSGMPVNVSLTPAQNDAARRLLSISKQNDTCYSAFYDHIKEERRRRMEWKKKVTATINNQNTRTSRNLYYV